METLHSTIFKSKIGPLFLAASERGLVALEFDARLPGQQTIRPNPRDLRTETKALKFTESAATLRPYVQELQEYFAGQRREFSFPLDLRGTDFQIACWRALLTIPYGETRTYADIARAVGSPQGVPRRWHGQQSQPDRDRRPVPSCDRLRRNALRLRRWPRPEAQAVGTGRRPDRTLGGVASRFVILLICDCRFWIPD